jgi:Ni2+-binding GTPase involved in maturation of urease and hydrogenase
VVTRYFLILKVVYDNAYSFPEKVIMHTEESNDTGGGKNVILEAWVNNTCQNWKMFAVTYDFYRNDMHLLRKENTLRY